MQMVIKVSFKDTLPSAHDVEERLRVLSGTTVQVSLEETQTGYVHLIRFAGFGETFIQFWPKEMRALIEVEHPPTHVEWLVTAALEDLGGTPSQTPPEFARRPLHQVSWWTRLQLRRRFLGSQR
jgi:hypothetical protein